MTREVEDTMNTTRLTHLKLYAAGLLVALGLLGAISPVDAVLLRVPTDYRTIQTAIDAAAPRDTVTDRSRTYTEQLRTRSEPQTAETPTEATLIRPPSKLTR